METKEVLKIEGISPDMLWTFMVVLVGLVALFLMGYKVVEVIRKEKQRRQERQQLDGQDITDRIADKVMDKLTPQIDEKFAEFSRSVDLKFEEIDNKLKSDKDTLTLHTTQLNDHESRVSKLEGANYSLCHGMLALLERDPALAKEQKAMKNYLIDGKYNEEDWK